MLHLATPLAVPGMYRLYCETCGIELDIVTSEELAGIARGSTPTQCWGCAGDEFEVVHSCMLDEEWPYTVVMDDTIMVIDPTNKLTPKGEMIICKKEERDRLMDIITGQYEGAYNVQ